MRKININYAARISIIYWLLSIVWIYTSDTFLESIVNNSQNITHLQTIKGLGFITFTALLIFFLVRYYQNKQRTIENQIIENEERLRLLIENSMDAILLSIPDGKILSANPAAERIFERSAQEIITVGRNGLIDLSDPRLPEALAQRNEKGYFVGELNFVKKDGTVFPCDVSTQLFSDSEGNPRSSMIIRDISERKRLEKQLEDTNLRMKNILVSISDAMLTIDRNWTISYINPRAAEINQKTIEAFLGNNFWDEFPAIVGTPFEQLVRKGMSERIAAQSELHYYIEGKYDIWLEVNIYPSKEGLTLIYRDINEKKILQESLFESEERLRLAVSGAQQGIYDLNIQTGEVIVNDIYAEMLGFDPRTFKETVEGWKSRLHPEDYEFATQYFDDYISGIIEEYNFEFRFKTAEGNYIWVLSMGSIVQRDANDKPLRMLGTHTDITERKQAEQEKNLFSHILAESLNEIYIFDAETYQFVQVNQAATSNLGYSMDELKKMTPVDIKPEVTQEQFLQIITPLREGKEKQIIFETIHQRKDKSTYDVEVHLQLQNFGHESLFTAIIMDITDRKRQETLIKKERQRLASIIRGTNVATWEWNVQSGETIFNDRWAEMLGYTIDELQPISIETWQKLTHPEDLKKANQVLQAHFSGDIDYYDVEFRMKHKDGHWVWIQDRGSVSVWTEDGQPLLMQGTHHDITQRKVNEVKILEQLEELQRWHQITLGREERIIELKQEINNLLITQGKAPKYDSVQK